MLLVDKPAGMTSHDVVAVARRAVGERRIGHAGTLDPFATGLLVLLLGRATRLLPFVGGEPKVYEATIRFGVRTDTDDLTGVVVEEAPLPTEEAVLAQLPALTASLHQLPPDYSARQVGGVRAYAAARAGRPLALAATPVTVHGWEVRGWERDRVHVTITCSGGTFIRSLARDLGRLSGSAAHLVALRRTRSGPFDVADAVSVEDLRAGNVALEPPLAAMPELPVRSLSSSEERDVGHGRAIVAGEGDPDRVALVDGGGALVAVARREGELLRPRVVLRAG